EELSHRRHCATRSNEGLHEPGTAHLLIAEVNGGTEITKLEIFHKFVVVGESAWWAAEFTGIVPVKNFVDCPPFLGSGHHGISNLQQSCRFRVPQARCGERAAWFKVQIEAGRMNVFAAV